MDCDYTGFTVARDTLPFKSVSQPIFEMDKFPMSMTLRPSIYMTLKNHNRISPPINLVFSV
jgi:hypothetical protein